MQRGRPTCPRKPRSLTFADFEDICTIPTSGNILSRLLLLHNHSGNSASYLHVQLQPYNLLISLLCCALSSLSTRHIPANYLLLDQLCCALEFWTSYSSNSLRVSMYQLQAPFSVGSSLTQPSHSAMRPWLTTKLNCSVNAYHSCSLHRCLQTMHHTHFHAHTVLLQASTNIVHFTANVCEVQSSYTYISRQLVSYSISEHTCTYTCATVY